MIKFYYHPRPTPPKSPSSSRKSACHNEIMPVDTRRASSIHASSAHQSQRQDACDSSMETRPCSIPTPSALSRRKIRQVPAENTPAARGTNAVVADVHRERHRSLFRPGRAFQTMWRPNRREYGVNRLYVSRPSGIGGLSTPTLAANKIHAGRPIYVWRHGAVGLDPRGAVHLRAGGVRQIPTLKAWFDGVNARPAVARAEALKDKHAFKMENDAGCPRAHVPASGQEGSLRFRRRLRELAPLAFRVKRRAR